MALCGYPRDPPASTCLIGLFVKVCVRACARSLSASDTQAGVCKPASAPTSTHNKQTADLASVPSPPLWHILEKHVDVIRSFCSTLEAVSSRSKRRQRRRGKDESRARK